MPSPLSRRPVADGPVNAKEYRKVVASERLDTIELHMYIHIDCFESCPQHVF